MTNYIYVLKDPRTDEVRYVGKTANLKTRLKTHISKARAGDTKHHCANWIRSLISEDVDPVIEVVRTVSESEIWQDVEREVIAEHIKSGCSLTNATSGGEGVCGLPVETIQRRVASRKKTMLEPEVYDRWLASVRAGKNRPESLARASSRMTEAWSNTDIRSAYIASMATDEARRRRSEASKAAFEDSDYRKFFSGRMKEVCGTDEFRTAQSERAKAAWADEEVTARRIQSLKDAYKSPELKVRMVEVGTEIGSRPEVKAKKSKASKAMWADVDRRAELLVAFSAPETKAKQSVARMAAWADKDKREEMISTRWTDEARAKQSERLKSPEAAVKIAATLSDPEMIKRRNASIKASWARRKAAKLEIMAA